MEKNFQMVVTCKLPWWFNAYIYGLAATCIIFRTEPDPEKIYDFVIKHMKIKFETKEVK